MLPIGSLHLRSAIDILFDRSASTISVDSVVFHLGEYVRRPKHSGDNRQEDRPRADRRSAALRRVSCTSRPDPHDQAKKHRGDKNHQTIAADRIEMPTAGHGQERKRQGAV